MFKKILVPVDGSKYAYKALDYALDLAKKYDAEIEIISVLPTIEIWNIPGYTDSNELNKMLTYYKELLCKAEERAKNKNPDLKITSKFLQGRPSDQIIEAASKEKTDLIVIASRGIGEITGPRLGKVSGRVLRNAKCPVIIIK